MPKIDKANINKAEGVKIPLKYLVTIIVSALVGFFIALLAKNYASAEELNLSTIDIVNLVVSVGLSVSSIVLSIIAIDLGKKTENILLERNEAGIRYQSDIFHKTIEVLTQIGTSTGISEKR